VVAALTGDFNMDLLSTIRTLRIPTGEMLAVRTGQIVKHPPTKVPTVKFYLRLVTACKLLIDLEAAIGIEPMNKGFAVHLSW